MAKQPVRPAPDPDATEAARLRVAHEVLDERPSPSVRAAVLRAAAESVRSASAAETVRAPRQRPARSWLGWRPAAAAGATVAVGMLAVGIATHVERETSTDTAVERRSESPPPQVVSPVSPAASPVPSPLPSYNVSPAAASRADAPSARTRPFAPARDGIVEAKQAAAAEPPAKKTRQAVSPEAPAEQARAAVAPAPPVEEAKPAATPAPTSATAPRAQARMMQAPAADAGEREATQEQAAAPVAKQLSQDQAGVLQSQTGSENFQHPASPDEWLRRIIELRRAGRSAEADAQLTRFRATFPKVKIPDDALR
jgi:hypothetical protein